MLTRSGKRSLILEAGDKTRTCDRLITNQLLYQLSYTSKPMAPCLGLTAIDYSPCLMAPTRGGF
jgi:hypothetical protein